MQLSLESEVYLPDGQQLNVLQEYKFGLKISLNFLTLAKKNVFRERVPLNHGCSVDQKWKIVYVLPASCLEVCAVYLAWATALLCSRVFRIGSCFWNDIRRDNDCKLYCAERHCFMRAELLQWKLSYVCFFFVKFGRKLPTRRMFDLQKTNISKFIRSWNLAD